MNDSPSTVTSAPPSSGSTISSSSPVSSAASPSAIRSPQKPQPASSGLISSLYKELLHFRFRGHRVRASQARGHDRPGRVAEPHPALEVPVREQAVAQRAPERV